MAWPNSTLLAGDAIKEVGKLLETSDVPLTILGSGELVRSLHPGGLIDRYVLQIHPVVLGSGTQLFSPGQHADLKLARSITTNTGVIIAVYEAQQ